jgi:predicted DsbA family dithiol-disulfide isomerase
MEAGIASYRAKHPDQSDTFATTWFPFYLNADSPKVGVSKREFYLQKFGAGRTDMMQQRLKLIGEGAGINFKFGGNTGNTRNSHRLIQLGKIHGPETQARVIEELFKAYFENEKDITSSDVLLKAGVEAGLEETEVSEWLGSDRGGPEVDKEVGEASRKFISGVPSFTINGKWHLEGAQDPSEFVKIFESIVRDSKATATAAGDAC